MTLTTRELLARLERHYIKPSELLPGGVFLPEVGWNGHGVNGTGGTCDAIYVGFTSTSGRLLVGHELKVSRADWVKELNSPGKADGWADECHQWYLVVGDPEIVRPGELPHGWGLMAPGRSKARMDIKVRAETKANHNPSWLAVRSIIARQDTLRASAIAEGRRKADERARLEIDEQIEKRIAHKNGLPPEVQAARSLVKILCQDRRRWEIAGLIESSIEELADAVCEVLDGQHLLTTAQQMVKTKLSAVENALSELGNSWQYKNLVKLLDTSDLVSGDHK